MLTSILRFMRIVSKSLRKSLTQSDVNWRLIPCIEASGPVQMAIDTWLLAQHQLGQHPPTLRFYTWSPAAISLGYHQKDWPEHWQSLVWQDAAVDLVRRPTGGRAVLHHGDLTYAIVTSGLQGRRLEVYQYLCDFLIRGWQSLGMELAYGQRQHGYHHQANCFRTATGADLVLADGTKLVGSAQLYRDGVVLQHGSMQIRPNRDLWHQVFEDSFLPQPSDMMSAIDQLSIDTIIAALVQAVQDCWNIQLITQPLTSAEWHAILPTPLQTPAPQSDPQLPLTL
jgi:lipoate---protein ligase